MVIVAASEIFLRVFVVSPSVVVPDPELGWAFRGGETILQSGEGYARNRLNSLGLNDGEIRAAPRDRVVLALGDSYTAALQVPQDLNFTSVAEKLAPCLDVVNAGRAGSTAVHYPIILGKLDDSISFDDIVVVFTTGDIEELKREDVEIFYSAKGDIRRVSLRERKLSKMRRLLDPIFSVSSLATYLKDRFRRAKFSRKEDRKGPESPKRRKPGISPDVRDLFQYAIQELRQHAPTHVLFIPSYEYLADRVAAETRPSILASAVIRSAASAARVPFRRVEGLARSYRRTGKPPNGFANNDIRRGHLNTAGHEIAGTELARFLGGCHS